MNTSKNKSKVRGKKKKQPKVYIPLNKVIILCTIVVGLCSILLFITTVKENNTEEIAEIPSIETIDKRQTEQELKTNRQQENKHISEDKPVQVASSIIQKPQQTPTQNQIAVNTIPERAEVSRKETETNNTNSNVEAKFSIEIPQAENGAILSFVFDDAGNNLNQLEYFVSLPFPVTIAVMPKLAYSKACADRIRKSGNEVILHQPMQAVNLNVNPGAGSITPNMNEDDIRSVLFQNLIEVGPVAGINNHEGSLITADAEKMSYIMKIASDEGIYFLDSRTNSDSKVKYVSSQMGYSYFERNVFLDNTKNRNDIEAEILKGLKFANKNGSVIMIGHVWSGKLLSEILIQLYPVLKTKGYRFSVVSKSGAIKWDIN